MNEEPGKQYEYVIRLRNRAEPNGPETVKFLNECGKEGWHLAAVTHDVFYTFYYFARSLPKAA